MTLKRLLAGLGLAALMPLAAQAAPGEDALMKAHRGGTLKLTASGAAGTIDPMINYELKFWQLYAFTYDGLVTFRKTNGKSSNDVVADLATAMPKIEDGGKTYVFTLHTGVKFSNGQDLTGKDVVASFERLFKVSNPNAGSWFNGIVGADACLKTAATCTLPQGVVDDEAAHTITVHLTAPDSEFLYKLSTPFGSILPAATAGKDLGTQPAPGTGPYMFASYDPNKALIMKRNPYFKVFSTEAQPDGFPDEIDYAFGLQDEAEVTAVLNGQYDWMFDEKPLDRLTELSQPKYAKQVFVHPLLAYYYMPLNVNLPPFNNAKAREAVAYAVDRNAIVKLFGGPKLGAPLCQQLPVGMPGYEPYCPFTAKAGSGKWTAPDMAKAKQLVQESGTAGQKVTVISSNKVVEKSIGEYLSSLLRNLGYDAQAKALSSDIQFTYIQNTNNKVQASLTDWYQDYPAPSDFMYVLFGCDSFHAGSDNSINIAGWCDKKVDGDMKKALATAVTDPEAAATQWAQVDKEITDAVPAVSLFQPKYVDLIGKRVGNYVWSDQEHMLFDRAWVK
jgi:peptide/nickel transport system substrate-binding protein